MTNSVRSWRLSAWRQLLAASALLLTVSMPATALGPTELAVIVNDADPLSVAIADYYRVHRHIPQGNMVHVNFNASGESLSASEFEVVRARVEASTPITVQAYALTWVKPYRVECMSITSAFATGFDRRYCTEGCTATPLSRYFNSNSHRPYDELRLRPTMSLAAVDLPQARALIDRGVAADGSAPKGTAYLVRSGDRKRDVRSAGYSDAAWLVDGQVRTRIADDFPVDRDDVMFYFVGIANVPDIATNHYLPGAVADHLTSYGGDLLGRHQMSVLRWLEAGVTGSYGTVVEPCNITAKFPNPGILMRRYLTGDTLIEAYWKSVLMPSQGIFVGEPLATPYRRR